MRPIASGPCYEVFPFPEGETFICGSSFTHRNLIHIISGYNFKDMMRRKYPAEQAVKKDSLSGEHIALRYEEGILHYTVGDLEFSRLIGSSCVWSEESETAYLFGGIHEEVGPQADPEAIFVSNLLVSHRFREGMECTRTLVAPIGVVHPRGRVFHSSAWDYERQSVWIFGGGTVAGKQRSYNDLWEYQTTSMQWIEYEKPKGSPAAKWGQSVVYYDRKLWIYGGSEGKSGGSHYKSMWVIDLSDVRRMQCVRVKLPAELRYCKNGLVMTVVEHPMVGPRIVFTGGCNDAIYTVLGFSTDITVAQNAKAFKPLSIVVLDPRTMRFDALDIDDLDLPNVSYHAASLLDNGLYLIGGLNHSLNNDRLYNRTIIRLNIFELISNSHKVLIPTELPDVVPQYVKLYPEYKKLVDDEMELFESNERLQILAKIMAEHADKPYPLEQFTFIGPCPCMTSVIHSRVGQMDVSKVVHQYAQDFVTYLYTGFVVPSHSKYDGFSNFEKFVRFCWENGLYRLICLEICLHCTELTVVELLTLACMSGSKGALVEDENLELLRRLTLQTLSDNARTLTVELDMVPNLECLAEDLILLLDPVPMFHIIDCPSLPPSNVLYHLSFLFPASSVMCRDGVVRINNWVDWVNKQYASHLDSEIVYAVVQLDSEPLIREGSPPESLVSALKLLNMSSSPVLDSMVSKFLFSDRKKMEEKVRTCPDLKIMLHVFLREISHRSILNAVLDLLGLFSVHVILDRKQNKLGFDPHFSIAERRFNWIQFDVDPDMLAAVAFLLYTGSAVSGVPKFFNRRKLALSILAALGDFPNIFSLEIVDAYRTFLQEELLSRPVDNLNEIIVGNFVRFYRLGLLKQVVQCSNPPLWLGSVLPDLEKCSDVKLYQKMLKIYNRVKPGPVCDRDIIIEIFES